MANFFQPNFEEDKIDIYRMAGGSSSSFFSQFWSSALRSKPPLRNSSHVILANPASGLVRRLGPLDLLLLGIGASIGAGIFVVTGTVARDAGPGTFHLTIQTFHRRIYP